MIREIAAVENLPIHLELGDRETDHLCALGRELAAKHPWWGAADDQMNDDRSVIAVHKLPGSRATVIFRDVVGAVRIGDLHIHVRPKIPAVHFWHIANCSVVRPRVSSSPAHVDQGSELVQLLARWCLEAAEQLLKRGLRKDYQEYTDDVSEVRGQIQPLATAQRIYAGVPAAVCVFEELSDDSSLNRVVKAACHRLAVLDLVSAELRRRARRVLQRMEDVGEVTYVDLRVRVDRLTASYRPALALSLLVLCGSGVTGSLGTLTGSAFLLRTPELMEDGLRSILTQGMKSVDVVKRRLRLNQSQLTINPDLVFGQDEAVGDIKYRYLERDWQRDDFNQLVTFATGFGVKKGALIGFAHSQGAALPRTVAIGAVEVSAFSWTANLATSPSQSATLLVQQLGEWLARSPESSAARSSEF